MVYVLTSVYMLLFVFMIHYVINCTLLHVQRETRLYIFVVTSAFTFSTLFKTQSRASWILT